MTTSVSLWDILSMLVLGRTKEKNWNIQRSLWKCLNSQIAFIANYHSSKVDNPKGTITYSISFAVAVLTKVERVEKNSHCCLERNPSFLSCFGCSNAEAREDHLGYVFSKWHELYTCNTSVRTGFATVLWETVFIFSRWLCFGVVSSWDLRYYVGIADVWCWRYQTDDNLNQGKIPCEKSPSCEKSMALLFLLIACYKKWWGVIRISKDSEWFSFTTVKKTP